MIYPIENKNDLTGAMLVIRFPEEDLDTKALYTIQADQPHFLLPFRFRCVDGEAECTYLLGNRVKLLYQCSSRSPGELTVFWEKVLQPLLDCADWFLNPFSFVLDAQYLYIDKERGTVNYIYVPSKQNCGDMETLREMTVNLAQENPSTDAELEVKVLRAIMQDFQPQSFLQMLRKNQPAILAQAIVETPVPNQVHVQEEPVKPVLESPQSEASNEQELPSRKDGDIVIDMSGGKQTKRGFWGNKEEKKKDKKKEKKKKGGWFGKKKEDVKDPPKEKEIVLGAAAEPAASRPAVVSSDLPGDHEASMLTATYATPEATDLTRMRKDVSEGAIRLQLIGNAGLPREIMVEAEPGKPFTIGRYDTSVGAMQSSFEFQSRTEEVSRHHAAIEKEPDGTYYLIDLASMAGTFVDGVRLTPNIPYKITKGNRISFGTCGADYIWSD